MISSRSFSCLLGKETGWPYPWFHVLWERVSCPLVLASVSHPDFPYVGSMLWTFSLCPLLPMASASLHLPTQVLSLWCLCLFIAICSSLSPAWRSSMIRGFWDKFSFHGLFHSRATMWKPHRPFTSIFCSSAPSPPLQPCQNDARTHSALGSLVGVWIFQIGRVAGKLLWGARAGHRKADQLGAWPGPCWALNEPFIQGNIWSNGVGGTQGSAYLFREEIKLWLQPSLQSLKREEEKARVSIWTL